MKVVCPVPTGSGAFVMHDRLRRTMDGYRLRPYSPRWEFFPPAIRWFSRGPADLIHAPADYGLFSRRSNVPQVLTLHGYNLDAAFRPYASSIQKVHYSTDLRWFMRHSIRRATVVTAVSRFTAELAFKDLGISRECRIIPNGIDTSRFTPRRSGRGAEHIRVLYSGNLSRRKGAHLLAGIADLLDANVKLVCASGLRCNSSPPFDHPAIEWLGSVPSDEMPSVYRSADMLLAPSFREGLSLAVLEAMSCGLPVVASDSSSFPEQIHAGRGGYLCPPGNVHAFAARINELASSLPARLEMGQYNRARVEADYDENRMIRQYAELFESVL